MTHIIYSTVSNCEPPAKHIEERNQAATGPSTAGEQDSTREEQVETEWKYRNLTVTNLC